MKRTLFAGILGLLLLSLAAGCGNKAQQEGKQPVQQPSNIIRMANVIFPGSPPQGMVMLQNGILKEKLGADYTIKPIYTRSIDKVSKEMKNNAYDFIFCYYGTISEYASNMSEFDNGDNFVVIANGANGPGDKLLAQPSIKDIKQLSGKTIGVFNHDYAGVTTVATTLQENGLNTVERGGSVKIRVGDSGQMLKDFKGGKLDALMARASFKDPGFTLLKKPGEYAYGGNPPVQVLLVRKGYLQEHPDVVEKVLDAYVDTTEWIKTHRSETAEIVWSASEKFYQSNKMEALMPPKPAMAELYQNLPVTVYPNLKFINDMWDYMEKYNPKKPYPKDSMVDFSLLNKVLKSKGMPTVEEYTQSAK